MLYILAIVLVLVLGFLLFPKKRLKHYLALRKVRRDLKHLKKGIGHRNPAEISKEYAHVQEDYAKLSKKDKKKVFSRVKDAFHEGEGYVK